MVYEVFFKEEKIGELSIAENYNYIADEKKIAEIEEREKIKLLPDVEKSKEAKDIPFFRVRIENCERKSVDNYPNSQYTIKKKRT